MMPGTYVGIWQTFVGQQHSDPGDAGHPVAGAQGASRSSPPTAWPTAATPSPAASSAPRCCPTDNPTLDFRRAVPAAEAARHERCGVPHGLLPRRRGKCVAVPRFSSHLDDLHAHDDRRARPSDRGCHRLVVTPSGRSPAPIGSNDVADDGVARYAVSARRHLRRRRHQLLAVLRGRRARSSCA